MGSNIRNGDQQFRTIPKVKYNLKLKMITSISFLIIGIFFIFVLFLNHFISQIIEEQVGKRALNLAQSVAMMPDVKEALLSDTPSTTLQTIVTSIQKDTGAEFIVVGNLQEIRYTHPNINLIGGKMTGGDSKRALTLGESYVSKKEGTLGLSIRGKVPVYSGGKVIGIVSVGFLNENVQDIISNESKTIWYTFSIAVLIGVLGAIYISSYIKKLLFYMEPEEISYLYLQNEAMLQSTHEGIVAIDRNGIITNINLAATKIIGEQEGQRQYIGMSIKSVIPLFDHFEDRYTNREMIVGDSIAIVNQTPLYQESQLTGVLFTFRKKNELQRVTEELSRIKQYANAQRAQTHEYSNRLHIILGLLLNNQKKKAIDFIKKEINLQNEQLQLITKKVSDPLIHALLQGKFNQASELGITLTIHPDSHLQYQLTALYQDALLTALGNVIENAMEAVKELQTDKKEVTIFFSDTDDYILFEVEDSGNGIEPQNDLNVFEQGFSTKRGMHRGTGLALTRKVLHDIGGEILLEEGDLGGACFVIIIPKKREDKNERKF